MVLYFNKLLTTAVELYIFILINKAVFLLVL